MLAMLREYVFRPVNVPLITPQAAARIVRIAASQRVSNSLIKVRVTLDLGLNWSEALLNLGSGELILPSAGISLPVESLGRIKSSTAVYTLINGDLRPLMLYDRRARKYYKLRALGEDVPPTLEINGIHMHRIEGTDPIKDSEAKVRALGSLRRARVLDVCTGLGYTASLELRRGASVVTTVEADENVLNLATYNPWSRGLVRARILLGDAAEVIRELGDSSFTHVLHDPPRFALAGHLYGLEFYKEINRVLRPGGRLFHYVGKPGRRRGVSFAKGVKDRLRAAGFERVRWVETAQGFIAFKPRW